ncbi:dioxygenase [Nitrosomonas sp. PY1]|uniref:DODA-type extradiol aromatic ring-opening family dioxygenase n=1 Tax=Nitrosomonas sp. PY1 TaxID=1803906 RepID=UPI001FC828D4|nr:class III extradiol ring-cleavage dioxygenase [Nitrosomonas sp. PY1]GKS68237.1 dioxygenase [Nitrosomonas sp. PY1]
MNKHSSEKLSSVIYIPHGGGPLPILGDKAQEKLVVFLREIARDLNKPSAILIISAHWEEDQATITSGNHPELIYDYYGFPDEAYRIQYSAPGQSQLAKKISELLISQGIPAKLDAQRGFDHGMFIPLMLMYPEANIPCVQLSLLRNLNPEQHINVGKSLSSLRKENVLIIGSGMSFHNLQQFFLKGSDSDSENEAFDYWLQETCSDEGLSQEEQKLRLIDWQKAPAARYCHPREEHLLPLHVCYGVACADTSFAKIVFNQKIMRKKVTSFLW